MVSASGAAFSWAGNSRENRLTSFANDPVADPTGEAIYLRDDDSHEVWGAKRPHCHGGRTADGGDSNAPASPATSTRSPAWLIDWRCSSPLTRQ